MSEGAWRFTVAVLMVAVVSFYGGMRCAGRVDAAAVARADTLAARLDSIQLAGQVTARADSLRAQRLVAAETEAHDLRVRLSGLRPRIDTLVERVAVLDTSLADSLRVALIAERTVSDSAENANRVIIALWRDRWKSAVAERDSYRDVALALNRQLQAAVHRPVPGRRLRFPCAFGGGGAGPGGLGAVAGVGVCY